MSAPGRSRCAASRCPIRMRPCSKSRSVSQPLANDALQHPVGAGDIVNAKADPVVAPEIELCDVAVQMPLGAMLVDALHAPLEHAVEAFGGVGVDLARLRGFADFKEVRSLFINEIDGKVFTTSGGEDDGGGGDSGRRLGR